MKPVAASVEHVSHGWSFLLSQTSVDELYRNKKTNANL